MEHLLAFKIKSSFAKFFPYVQTHKVFAVIVMYKQKACCSTWHNFKNTFVDLHQHCYKHALLKSKSFRLEVITEALVCVRILDWKFQIKAYLFLKTVNGICIFIIITTIIIIYLSLNICWGNIDL